MVSNWPVRSLKPSIWEWTVMCVMNHLSFSEIFTMSLAYEQFHEFNFHCAVAIMIPSQFSRTNFLYTCWCFLKISCEFNACPVNTFLSPHTFSTIQCAWDVCVCADRWKEMNSIFSTKALLKEFTGPKQGRFLELGTLPDRFYQRAITEPMASHLANRQNKGV